jgi:PAS domain S-box-containing protein
MMKQAVSAGACGYVVKSAVSTELIAALNKAENGENSANLAVFGSSQGNLNVEAILQRSAALESALRESEERYRLTFEQAAVGIAHVAENGCWLRINRKICEMLGYEPEELLKLRFQDVTYPADVATDAELAALLATGKLNQYSIEKRYIRKDGAVRWARVHVAPVNDPKGSLRYFVRVIEDITERKQAEETLAREMVDLKLLQEISTQLIQEENGKYLYEKILDAAVSIMRSDFASMQLWYPKPATAGELLLITFRGFTPEAAKFWERVPADSGSTCAVALRTLQRVLVTNVEDCDFMAGTDDLTTYRQTGIRAVQSTPLLSRRGQLLGMISTHWRKVHVPTERDLRVFDVLARQAADILANKRSDEELRESAEELRKLKSTRPSDTTNPPVN